MPETFAPVTLIEGVPGCGKTTVATALMVDAKAADPKLRLFCNYHLYGVPYIHWQVTDMLAYLNTGVVADGIMTVDESYIGMDCRAGSNPLTKMLTWFGMQTRKRGIQLNVISQHGRFIDWRIRFIMARRIVCSYDERTHMESLLIHNVRRQTEKRVTFYAPRYWKYFNTNELPEVPTEAIKRALAYA